MDRLVRREHTPGRTALCAVAGWALRGGAMKAKSWKAVRQAAVDAGHFEEAEIGAIKEQLLAEVRAYKLAEVRAAAGLSQQELAEQLQVSQSRISRIEHGDLDRTELATLRKFARAIGGELELTLKLGDERFTLG